MAVDGTNRVVDADGNLIRAGVDLAIDAINNAFSGGTQAPNANQQAALIAAGYTRAETNQANPRTRNLQNWIAPDGTIYGPRTSREIAQQLIRTPPIAPPITPPSAGPSGPDQAGGFPPSIPLPSIPGLPSSLPLPPIIAAALPQALPAIITAGLFWPTAAGRGSDLRDLYAVPKATPKGRPRRRRSTRTRARPVATPGRGNPFPGTVPKGRGGPVTISRPAVARPQPVAVPARNPWQPSRAIPGVKIDVGPIKAPAPAQIPRTVTQRVQAVLSNPLVRGIVGPIVSGALGSLFVKSPAQRLGRVNLPNTIPSPLPLTNPLTAVQTQALPYARAFPATQAATQEQDCSCRPARKKRTKKPCKNPVTSRRSFARDGSRFITVTRQVKCQASSRKKPALRPVP